jgi:hypothetical protein
MSYVNIYTDVTLELIDFCLFWILSNKCMVLALSAWCLTTVLTIFQLYRDGQFYLEEETRVPCENHLSA